MAQSLTSEAQSALNVVQTLLSALSNNSSDGRTQFTSTLHHLGHMAHARYTRVPQPVFHNFEDSSPDSLQAFVAGSGCWNSPIEPKAGWVSPPDANGPSGPAQVTPKQSQGDVPEWEECIDGEATVMVDHDIAMVWTPYYFRRQGKLSHVGTNIFNLIKVYESGGNAEGTGEWEWKIAAALDTAREPSEEQVSVLLE